MNYDITLKDLFQNIPQRLLQLLVGSQATELLTVEYPTVKIRRPDLVAWLADGRLYHLELQSDNDETIAWRMLEYYLLLTKSFNQPPVQQVLYVGRQKLSMQQQITQPTLHFSYELLDIAQIDCEPLLASPSIEDNLLALLCHIEDKPQTIKAILEKIILLDENARYDALAKLWILAGLRTIELQNLIDSEVRKMPITIDTRDNIWFQEGRLKGIQEGELKGIQEGKLKGIQEGKLKGIQEGKLKGIQEGIQTGKMEGELMLLRRQLERRFGTLPLWILERLKQATSEELETWGLQLLEAKSLEDIFN